MQILKKNRVFGIKHTTDFYNCVLSWRTNFIESKVVQKSLWM
jgi:hypothetical protein